MRRSRCLCLAGSTIRRVLLSNGQFRRNKTIDQAATQIVMMDAPSFLPVVCLRVQKVAWPDVLFYVQRLIVQRYHDTFIGVEVAIERRVLVLSDHRNSLHLDKNSPLTPSTLTTFLPILLTSI